MLHKAYTALRAVSADQIDIDGLVVILKLYYRTKRRPIREEQEAGTIGSCYLLFAGVKCDLLETLDCTEVVFILQLDYIAYRHAATAVSAGVIGVEDGKRLFQNYHRTLILGIRKAIRAQDIAVENRQIVFGGHRYSENMIEAVDFPEKTTVR